MNKTKIPFSLRYGGTNNELGIWMECFGKDYLLSPQDLFLSMINEKGEIVLRHHSNQYIETGSIYFSKSSAIDFLFTQEKGTAHKDAIIWTIADFYAGESKLMLFARQEYSDAIKNNLQKLYELLKEDDIKAYDNINAKTIKNYISQFDVVDFVCRNTYNRYLKDAPQINNLYFTCEHHMCDIEYTLRFGAYELKSYISDWTTTLSSLREQLEQRKIVELFFDDSPTTLKLEPLLILKNKKKDEIGTAYYWENEISLLTIIPNTFCQEAYIVGLCRGRQIIKTLYEGLLRMASHKFVDREFKGTWDDVDCITFYNQIKSPIVENYICNRKTNVNNIVFCRQQRINHIITICPDFDYLYQDEEGICDGFSDKDTIEIDFENIGKKIIKIDGFEDWWKEYVNATDFANTTTDPSFDYEVWHKRGLVFAQKLREQLPDNIDLWYRAPYEDTERREQMATLIYKEYTPLSVAPQLSI